MHQNAKMVQTSDEQNDMGTTITRQNISLFGPQLKGSVVMCGGETRELSMHNSSRKNLHSKNPQKRKMCVVGRGMVVVVVGHIEVVHQKTHLNNTTYFTAYIRLRNNYDEWKNCMLICDTERVLLCAVHFLYMV